MILNSCMAHVKMIDFRVQLGLSVAVCFINLYRCIFTNWCIRESLLIMLDMTIVSCFKVSKLEMSCLAIDFTQQNVNCALIVLWNIVIIQDHLYEEA